uniref:NACHT domain-containing protein n=1 Tax=Moniliophthora roreri TaxID=221103 RepID=A0A0W0FIM2_MONRR
MFQSSHSFQISGGQFNVAGRDIHRYQINNFNDPLHDLWDAIKDVGASHNSETRYPPPKCDPDTRRDVMEILRTWIYSRSWWHRIFWLYGPAGAGKSAIAQTLAEMGQQEGFLVSSFFFSRGDPKRNNAKSLFLTITYALAISVPELRPLIEQALRNNPTVLQASLEEQFEKLIFEPCRSLTKLHRFPWLVVIDGLDECNDSHEQQRILFILATMLPKLRLRFLVCSRPEPPIREAFSIDPFRSYLHRIVLDNTFQANCDIEILLTKEFQRIRNHEWYRHIRFPVPWPAPGIIDELVQKASAQFIYANTVVKFIDNKYLNPCVQLEVILHPNLRPALDPESNSPFHDLDVLYHQILSEPSHPQPQKLRDVIWAVQCLYHHTSLEPTPAHIEALLMLHEGDVISTLHGMHSILHIGGPNERIQILHASFGDFLCDPTRSDDFFSGDARTQNSFLATHLLHAIDHYSRFCGRYEEKLSSEQIRILDYAWRNWGDHCSKSSLDEKVLDALRNADFTRRLGFYIMDYLRDISRSRSRPNASPSGHAQGIWDFYQQSRLLWKCLQKHDVSVDIIHRFSTTTSCLDVKISQSGIPDTILPQILDAAAIELGRASIDPSRGVSLPRGESSFTVGLYHIPLSMIISQLITIAMHDLSGWYYKEGRLDRPFSTYRPNEWLDFCGPCPGFLDSLSPRIIYKEDQDRILEWLQSFPPEYTSQTAPLIERVRAIECNPWREWLEGQSCGKRPQEGQHLQRGRDERGSGG